MRQKGKLDFAAFGGTTSAAYVRSSALELSCWSPTVAPPGEGLSCLMPSGAASSGRGPHEIDI